MTTVHANFKFMVAQDRRTRLTLRRKKQIDYIIHQIYGDEGLQI